MADGSAVEAMWMPPWGDMPKGPRAVMVWLIIWRDGRGSCDPTHEEIAEVTGFDGSTVRRHTGWLEREGWVTRERRRRADNSLGGYRYWLDLKRLGLKGGDRSIPAVAPEAVSATLNDGAGDRSNCAVASAGGEAAREAVGKPVESEGGATAQPTAQGTAQIERSPPEGPRNLSGPYREPAPARADFPFPSSSYFLSFPWRDEVTKIRAGEILAACGLGLGRLGEQGNRVLNSLAYVLEADGLWSGYDHGLDVLPVVKAKTGPGRGANLLWDFALLTDNLDRHRAKRLRPPSEARAPRAPKPKADAPGGPPVPPAEQRAKRIAALRRTIALFDDGHRQDWMLPKDDQLLRGTARERAFERVRAKEVEELGKLMTEAREDAAAASAVKAEG